MAQLENGDPLVSTQAEVANRKLQVNLPADPEQAGCVRIVTVDGKAIDVTENGYLRVSQIVLSVFDQIEGAAVNTNLWNPYDVSGMTIVQANNLITMNAGASIAANGYANLISQKFIPLYGSIPCLLEMTATVINVPEANATVELGIGTVSHGTAPTDGAYFRWSPSGGFYAVINNGGVETPSTNLASQTFTDPDGTTITLPPTTIVTHLYAFEVVEDKVVFYIDDIEVATVNVPSGQSYPFNAGRQQVFARVYIGGSSPSLAPKVSIGQVTTKYEDLQQYRPWGELLASLGRGAYQSPVTPFGQTANHVNSASPVTPSPIPSNTLAGYPTLGGRWQIAAPAGAATDLILFGFQVPAGFQFFMNSISISTINTGAIGSVVTPTILDWSLGLNGSALSLATVDGAGTWAPRRIPLGMQVFGLSAAVGALATDITRRFETPLVVDASRFLHVILQVPSGVATASQVLRGDVLINGFFE